MTWGVYIIPITDRKMHIPVEISYKSSIFSDQGLRYKFSKDSTILAKMAVLAKTAGFRHVYYMEH